MSDNPAKFIWYDVMTDNHAAAESFYTRVFGWEAADSGLTDRIYTIFSADGLQICGLMPIPENVAAMGGQPCWSGYVHVDDVDAYAERVIAAGGAVHAPAMDIPNVGRFAVVSDPYGAKFILFYDLNPPEAEPRKPGTPGHVGWHELHTGNPEGAFDFYAGLFGWSKTEAFDMGPLGVYQTFATGGPANGGIMAKTPETPAPFWLFYFNVEAIDAAAARVTENGGQIVHEPAQIPGGGWIMQCTDPQGALFAMVAYQR